MSPRPTVELLQDIADRIDAALIAEQRLAAAEAANDGELADTVLDAILYDIVVIGEAVKSLDQDVIEKYTELPWSEIAKMRDLLTHHYYKIDA